MTLAIIVLCLWSVTGSTSQAYAQASIESAEIPDRFKQRKLYAAALRHLRAGQMNTFARHRDALAQYPLHPYLIYHAALRRISRIDSAEREELERELATTPLAKRLYRAWMTRQAKLGRWQAYATHYDKQRMGQDAEKRCQYATALLKSGKKDAAFALAPDLWIVPTSQSEACDGLFSAWIDSGRLTSAMAWQRFELALDARAASLARYLVRFIAAEEQKAAERWLQVHRNPALLRNTRQFSQDDDLTRDSVLHGLRRFMRSDWQSAQKLWQRYNSSLTFSEEQQAKIHNALLIRQAREDDLQAPPEVLLTQDGSHVAVLEELMRWAIRKQAWDAVAQYRSLLPQEKQQEPAWRYWTGRAALTDDQTTVPQALMEDLAQLATERHYYGFMAARISGGAPQLAFAPYAITDNDIATVQQLPSVQRAFEFFATNDIINARREWFFALSQMSTAQQHAAAHLSARWGWHRQAIQAAIDAEGWDDLTVRFPLGFREDVLQRAFQANLDPAWVFAIIRQESAFMLDARSPVGALGLMQLMPTTAERVAQQIGLSLPTSSAPRRRSILERKNNIHLGTQYLSQLYRRFDKNRALAAAAYNAGPTRVDRWLKSQAAHPMDLWIEKIPFRETRNYVQNTLVYSFIYGWRMGQERPFLSARESIGLPIVTARSAPAMPVDVKKLATQSSP